MSDPAPARPRVVRKAVKRVRRALDRQGALPPGTEVEAALIAQTLTSLDFALFGAFVALFSKTFYIAVTDTHVFVLALSAGRSPGKIVAGAPFAQVRIAEHRRSGFNETFRIGVGERDWRLQCGRVYRSEVETLLARAGA